MSQIITDKLAVPVWHPRRLVSAAEVEEVLGLSEERLQYLRDKGDGPRFFRIGVRIYYRVEDIEGWLASCAVAPGVTKDAQQNDTPRVLRAAFIDALRGAPAGRPPLTDAVFDALNNLPVDRTFAQAMVEALAMSGGDTLRLYPNAGYMVLEIRGHVDLPSEHPPERVDIRVELDGLRWSSSYGPAWEPGFISLAKHVFFLRDPGDRKNYAAHKLMAILGAATLKVFFNGSSSAALAPAGNPPPLAPSIADLTADLDCDGGRTA